MGTRHSPPHLLAGTAKERLQVSETYGKLPLSFEANRGQTDPQVRFLSRGATHTLFLASTEAVLVFTTPEHPGNGKRLDTRVKLEKPGKASRTVLRMAFLGKNPGARVTGQAELPGKANYFIGNDPAKWRTNVPMYAQVQYRDLYPGIDLIYYGNQRQLEYDFVVRPGADPARIKIGVEGADALKVDAHGDLVMHTAAGAIRQRKPVIYQEIDGRRRDIAGGYVLRATHQVGFDVGAYDRGRPLVFDPVVLSYSTYLGGSNSDNGAGIAVFTDGTGSVYAYVVGSTTSPNFPVTPGAFQTAPCAKCPYLGQDAFVAKLNPAGNGATDLVYSTYLGGNGTDYGFGIAVDATGSAYVVGSTTSTNFPTMNAAQPTLRGRDNAFVTKLNPTGSGLVYSTYLGGSGADSGFGIAVDAAGNAYVTGQTASRDFPTTAGAFQPSSGNDVNAFMIKLNSTGSSLVYSTYLHGRVTQRLSGGNSIAVDAAGNVYVAGATNIPDFPTTVGAFQTTLGSIYTGPWNAFVAKLNPAGNGAADLVYFTYLGGSNYDRATGIVVDAAGNAYVTGVASSPDFPTTPGAFQTTLRGSDNAFVTKLNPAGNGPADLVYSTYLGGSGFDEGDSIAVDTAGNAYVTGSTSSPDFPTMNAFQTTLRGSDNAFVAELNPTGTGLVSSTYLGGSGPDAGYGIAIDGSGNAYVTGLTESTSPPTGVNFPTTAGAFQPSAAGGGADAFVAKVSGGSVPVIVLPGILGSWTPAAENLIEHRPTLILHMNTFLNELNTMIGSHLSPSQLVPWFRYNTLVSRLQAQGVQTYVMPYDWASGGARAAAQDLNAFIQAHGFTQVDIIAHSNGGLVAQQYIQDRFNANQSRNVRNLLLLGSPNQGAVKAHCFLYASVRCVIHVAGLTALNDLIFAQLAEQGKIFPAAIETVPQLMPTFPYLVDIDTNPRQFISNPHPTPTCGNGCIWDNAYTSDLTAWTRGQLNSGAFQAAGINVYAEQGTGLWTAATAAVRPSVLS